MSQADDNVKSDKIKALALAKARSRGGDYGIMLYIVRHQVLFRSLYSLFFVDHFIVKAKNASLILDKVESCSIGDYAKEYLTYFINDSY